MVSPAKLATCNLIDDDPSLGTSKYVNGLANRTLLARIRLDAMKKQNTGVQVGFWGVDLVEDSLRDWVVNKIHSLQSRLKVFASIKQT